MTWFKQLPLYYKAAMVVSVGGFLFGYESSPEAQD
jgi:hypothetical protein